MKPPEAVGQHPASLLRPGDDKHLDLALAAARLGAWEWDARSDLMTFSVRAAEIFGVALAPPITRAEMLELMHPEDREFARVAVASALRERRMYSMEHRFVKDGRERWVIASGHGHYDDAGNVLGMFGVVQDIASDRLLLRVDDAVRPLVKPEDITFTAARMLGEYLKVNRCAYAFVEDDQDTFGLTGNYTQGVESIVGRYRFRQFGTECLRLMRAGEAYVVEDSGTDPRLDEDDRRSYVMTAIRAVICVPILKSGRFVAAMAVHTKEPRTWSASEVELVQQVASRCWESIERARVEHERQALLEAARSANRAKDEFLAMLGHELRNPLAPIATALQLMKLRGEKSFERERTVIERQVDHLTRLVDDLLDVSRIARGKVQLKRELVELAEIVTSAVEIASPLFEQSAHQLVLDVPRGGLLVDGDPARLTQVITNLLTNACKYTSPGGRIEVSATVDGADIVISVRDNGIGMSAEVLPHIFGLFVQGRQASDRALGGLGLGLTIVKNLVEQHDGNVSAHSDGSDEGSEFVVRLPIANRAAAAAEPSIEPIVRHGNAANRLRILVVDDNEDAAEMLAAALRLHGCEVVVAHDGPQALNLAAGHAFGAALLDIGLPVMDGYELAVRLRGMTSLKEARLVAITGYGQESDRDRALASGFQQHLVKPVDMATLDALVASLV
ncbi:MAG TPA: ATP-binding protein [Burkholderiaceae bacterium]|nr:ATP-binding protein [Burkholderiaceae bacterium]